MSINRNKMKFIPESEVPYRRYMRWDGIFKAIPKGKALVMSEKDVPPGRVRAALTRRHKQGRYKNISVIVRGKIGERTIYVINRK